MHSHSVTVIVLLSKMPRLLLVAIGYIKSPQQIIPTIRCLVTNWAGFHWVFVVTVHVG